MSLLLSDEQVQFRDSVREFTRREITPELIRKCEQDRRPPMHLLAAVAANDWLSVGIPEEFGGSPDYVCVALLLEELGYGYLAAADLVYRALIHGAGVLINYGTPTMREELLPRLLRGELLFLNGISEPGTGADASSLTTKAVPDGTDYVINGHKIFNTGMGFSDYVVCYARTDPEAPRHRGISAILVPTNAEGLTFREIDTVGYRAIPTYEAWYEDVRVPATNVVGELHGGWSVMMGHLEKERLGLCALASGATRRVLDDTVAYAGTREQFGRPIGAFQAVSHMIADIKVLSHTSQLTMLQLAALVDAHRPARMEASIAKIHCAESYARAADLALQVWGAYGYSTESDVNRHWRDARLMPIGGGSTQIQKNVIGKLLGLPAAT